MAALFAGALGDRDGADRALARFAAIADTCPSAALDVMTGASGLLLGAALLVEQLPDGAGRRLLPLGERLSAQLSAAAGRSGAVAQPLAWLGAAHGWCGLAHAQLRWCQATRSDPGASLRELLDRLAGSRPSAGLWPRRLGSDEVWRGWCHGSAGWAQLWTLAHELLGEPELLALAARSAAHAVRGGGGAALCCGFAGEAYAALALHRATDDAGWLKHARRLGGQAARKSIGEDFPEHSLWRGDVGVALLVLELEEPARAAMPLYRALT